MRSPYIFVAAIVFSLWATAGDTAFLLTNGRDAPGADGVRDARADPDRRGAD